MTAMYTEKNLLDGLNEKQLEAVVVPDESAIILAGAGSGKTKVLTTRVAYLMDQGRATPQSIMAVTFTNKAAKEMKDRLGKMVDVNVRDMWIGTFHGICQRMLRENARLAGLPGSFTIMDQDDQLAMIKRMIKEDDIKMPDETSAGDVQKYIVRQKEQGTRPEHTRPADDFEAFASQFYGAYEVRCAKEGVLDFSELMLRVIELLRSNQDFKDCYAGRFSHLHVDEFQDTNPMQYEWLRHLKGPNGVIFAVGDDDQSIYSFRGSRPENMMDFVKDESNGKIIRLEQNYRSTSYILEAANALIDKNTGRMGKNLWTDSSKGSPMECLEFSDDRDESDFIARQIKKKIQNGQDPSEIAILYRSHWQSRSYEKALVAHGVPYAIYGGTKFFERVEVKHILAYMRLAINLYDDGAFRRVINVPARGLGDGAISKIAEFAKEHDYSMLEAAARHPDAKLQAKVGPFISNILAIFEDMNTKNFPDFFQSVIDRSGLMEFYSKKEEDKDRKDNILEMKTAAQRFCEESTTPDALTRPAVEMMVEFMAASALESGADVGRNADNPAGVEEEVKTVTLMTVHASKGLEFDSVYVVGADQEVFPVKMALDEGNEEEERRLMYVAITRAKHDIHTSRCETRMIHGEVKDLSPSQFLSEIPDDLKTFQKMLREKDPRQHNQKKTYGSWSPKR